jgi:hypothetical protein
MTPRIGFNHPEIIPENFKKKTHVKHEPINKSITKTGITDLSLITKAIKAIHAVESVSPEIEECFSISSAPHCSDLTIEEYKILYHTGGETACGGPSTLLRTNARKGDLVTSSIVKHLDGSYYANGEILICDACGDKIMLLNTEQTHS